MFDPADFNGTFRPLVEQLNQLSVNLVNFASPILKDLDFSLPRRWVGIGVLGQIQVFEQVQFMFTRVLPVLKVAT